MKRARGKTLSGAGWAIRQMPGLCNNFATLAATGRGIPFSFARAGISSYLLKPSFRTASPVNPANPLSDHD